MNKKIKRFLSYLMIFSLLISIPSISLANETTNDNGSQPTTSTPIIGKPTTTIYQMKQWAKSKGANQLFIDLANDFYNISLARGVDPAVTYTQSAKETNFMKFTGVLDASYNNPCGMKNSAGGGDYDGEAHKRFNSWSDGIYAQVDHLALYAGKSGYPKYSADLHNWYLEEGNGNSYNVTALKRNGTTTDPRHFSSIFGKCPTVESLGANWAPSETYGEDIVKYMNELYTFPYSTVIRYAGSDRYETAKLINKAAGVYSSTAIISSGQSFPDTIIASILAGQLEGKLFINKPNTVTSEINSAVESGSIKTIYTVGGNALPNSFKNTLKSKGIELINLVGPNRYDTSALVAEKSDNNSKVILANGNIFADSLSMTPVALQNDYSLVLTDGNRITDSVRKVLNNAKEVIIVGGTNTISASIGDNLKKSGKKVSRISGTDRYATSISIANSYFKNTDFVLTASGNNYADALMGTTLSNRLKAPIILVNGDKLSNSQINYLESNKINTLYILGGNSSISKKLESNIKSLLDK
ncbi:cell wall-binding repeat-containing protein [Miniphocaeibacter halophilus]|uniref:Cell wall-binding repeat-containing protein n=1 Tax=Miniphocaeibacter halophilus TaxID=2931922 RepID=A0AC61MSC4_9FIRM|nr:cell wall-binding repeat-containing protein [Miniphocaeibacter halophilus]QQK08570.1 cell wall-binding repeat-containing protein [Miniphocaeibacter halophilus]